MSIRRSPLKSTLLASGMLALALAGVVYSADATPAKPDMFGDGKTKIADDPPPPDPIADATKLVVKTRKDKDAADLAFNTLVKKLKAQYLESEDFKKVLADAKTADDAYNAAAAPVMATLDSDPKYTAYKNARDGAQKELDAMIARGGSSVDDRTDASMRITSNNAKMTEMQQAALDAADSLKDLKTADDAAKAAVTKAKKDFETTLIRENPDWIKARSDQAAAAAAAAAARQALAALQNPTDTGPGINADISAAAKPAAPAKVKKPMVDKKGRVIPGYYQ